MKYNLKKNRSYELNLIVTLDKNDLNYYISEAEKHLANDLKMEGFRKGKVPLNIAKDKLDKKQVLETAFDFAFRQSFADILTKEKLELIDAGKFEVKENSPEKVVYSILLTVFPELKISDYRGVQIQKKGASVSKAEESRRVQAFVLDKVAESTKVEIPPLLLNRQLDQMMLDLDSDLHRRGMELGLFLAKIKKTRDKLLEEWKPKAELLVKKSLILRKIARLENIKVEPEEVKIRINQFL
ncbi:MAG: trigger factor, partial [Patescibacteria group bacterium]